jgi:hypothetical protein
MLTSCMPKAGRGCMEGTEETVGAPVAARGRTWDEWKEKTCQRHWWGTGPACLRPPVWKMLWLEAGRGAQPPSQHPLWVQGGQK